MMQSNTMQQSLHEREIRKKPKNRLKRQDDKKFEVQFNKLIGEAEDHICVQVPMHIMNSLKGTIGGTPVKTIIREWP